MSSYAGHFFFKRLHYINVITVNSIRMNVVDLSCFLQMKLICMYWDVLGMSRVHYLYGMCEFLDELFIWCFALFIMYDILIIKMIQKTNTVIGRPSRVLSKIGGDILFSIYPSVIVRPCVIIWVITCFCPTRFGVNALSSRFQT